MNRIRTSLLVAAAMLLAAAPLALAGGEEEASGAGASTIPAGYFGTYEPAIDMEWIKSTWQSARERVNNDLQPATGETFEDNRWTRAMREELGINVTYKWVVDGAQAQEKLKLAMASGDLPDVITLEGGQRLVDFQQLAEADLLADMTDVWEQYASPLAKEVVGADGQVIYNAVSHGGRLKGIPGPSAGLDTYSYFWVRQDWLDNLGTGAAAHHRGPAGDDARLHPRRPGRQRRGRYLRHDAGQGAVVPVGGLSSGRSAPTPTPGCRPPAAA